MNILAARAFALTVTLCTVSALLGCTVVRKHDEPGAVTVSVATPVGGMVARTGEDAGNTGIPVYPGAQLSRDDDDTERANVTIGTPWFGLHVVAVEYESDDTPGRVVDYYRERMKTYGDVTECRGDVNFKDGRPVCRSQPFSPDVQLLVGAEHDHRIVSVKPRGTGSEFALVAFQTGAK